MFRPEREAPRRDCSLGHQCWVNLALEPALIGVSCSEAVFWQSLGFTTDWSGMDGGSDAFPDRKTYDPNRYNFWFGEFQRCREKTAKTARPLWHSNPKRFAFLTALSGQGLSVAPDGVDIDSSWGGIFPITCTSQSYHSLWKPVAQDHKTWPQTLNSVCLLLPPRASWGWAAEPDLQHAFRIPLHTD